MTRVSRARNLFLADRADSNDREGIQLTQRHESLVVSAIFSFYVTSYWYARAFQLGGERIERPRCWRANESETQESRVVTR